MRRFVLSIHDDEINKAFETLVTNAESFGDFVTAVHAIQVAENLENTASAYDGEPEFMSARQAYNNAHKALRSIGFSREMIRRIAEVQISLDIVHD